MLTRKIVHLKKIKVIKVIEMYIFVKSIKA